MTVAPSALHRRRRRIVALSPARVDLALSSGDLQLSKTGVRALFRPPLERFSRHYDWWMLPLGIAAIKLLVFGRMLASKGVIDPELVKSVDRKLGMRPHDVALLEEQTSNVELEWYIGPDEELDVEFESPLVEDSLRIANWAPTLAFHCSNPLVRKDLQQLPGMSLPELSRYVSTRLPG